MAENLYATDEAVRNLATVFAGTVNNLYFDASEVAGAASAAQSSASAAAVSEANVAASELVTKAARDEAVLITGIPSEDGAVAYLVGDAGSETRAALGVQTAATLGLVDAVADHGADPTGVVDATTALNAAAAAAAAQGKTLYARGTYRITGTITIQGNVDMAGATLQWYGASGGVALQLGTRTSGLVSFVKTAHLPDVIHKGKSGTAWGSVAGSIGVRATNLNTWRVFTGEVADFETGFSLEGLGAGNAYNTVSLGHLRNNKINLTLTADATGWANQNLFLGGRLSHSSGEGTAVTGCRHLLIPTTPSLVNNNVWVNTSFEGAVPEYHMECAGALNLWETCRWENGAGGCRIWWRLAAHDNHISDGYDAKRITSTYESGTASQYITIPSDVSFGGRDQAYATDYTTRQSYLGFSAKSLLDPYDRVLISPTLGIKFGGGASAPLASLLPVGTSGIGIKDGNLYASTDNTQDVGLITSLRFRYIRAATCTVTGSGATGSRPTAATAGVGATWFDTTLGRPIWSTGSAWVKSDGTAA